MDRQRPKSKAKLIKRTIVLAAGAAVLVIGGITLASIDFSSQRVDRDKITIATVDRGTLEIKVSANGRLMPKNLEYIAAQVTGRVIKTHRKPGDHVKAGELLVELANPQVIATADEARSAWEGALKEATAAESELRTNLLNQEAVLVQRQFEFERANVQLEAEERLIGEKIVSEIEFKRTKLNVAQQQKLVAIEESRVKAVRENIKVQLAAQKYRVEQLERALDRATNQVENLHIAAGIDGIVQAIDVEVGQQLQAGSPVGRIAQHDHLYAELRVPAREAAEVAAGQNVIIDTRSGTVNGVVTRVDPAVTEGTVIVDVDLQGELPGGARPQLQVEGTIYLVQIPDTLYVGKPAYVRSDRAMTVYKLDPAGRYANRVSIKAGKLSVNTLQVLEGLAVGDRIITSEIGEWQDKERILIN